MIYMCKPIPRSMLPNQCNYYKYLGVENGVHAWEEPILMTYVAYVDIVQSLKISSEVQDINCKAKLFYDCLNSRPKEIEFSIMDKVEICGKTMSVSIVKKPFALTRQAHHYEIELV